MTQINRRNFIKFSGAAAALAVTPPFLQAQENGNYEAHVVVVGGGFAGATAAKYLRLWSDGKIKVTLVDKNPHHVTCVLSNLVLNDRLKLTDITQSYTSLQDNYGVIVRQGYVTEVTEGMDKTVHLEDGTTIDCDFVILAPGIEFIDIPGLKEGDFNRFDQIPHAWVAGPQTTLLRDQLHDLPSGGAFVMTVPKAPYRCPPGPYERACVVADFIKRVKGAGKVIVLDLNPDITVEKETFNQAFSGIYQDIVEYYPNVELIHVDSDNRIAFTNQGNFEADVLNVIPTHKAGKIAEDLGLVVGSWAPVDLISYESTLRPGFYVIGDSNNSGQPKSGHMANAQAKVCVDAIIRTIADRSKALVYEPTRLSTLKTNSACYSPITYDQASWLSAVFAYDTVNNAMRVVEDSFASSTAPHWSSEHFEDMFEWANSLFSNSFR
ncbi:MAG: FAD-dependent oxidoreductase [Gammaproteobacteria bacterium]